MPRNMVIISLCKSVHTQVARTWMTFRSCSQSVHAQMARNMVIISLSKSVHTQVARTWMTFRSCSQSVHAQVARNMAERARLSRGGPRPPPEDLSASVSNGGPAEGGKISVVKKLLARLDKVCVCACLCVCVRACLCV